MKKFLLIIFTALIMLSSCDQFAFTPRGRYSSTDPEAPVSNFIAMAQSESVIDVQWFLNVDPQFIPERIKIQRSIDGSPIGIIDKNTIYDTNDSTGFTDDISSLNLQDKADTVYYSLFYQLENDETYYIGGQTTASCERKTLTIYPDPQQYVDDTTSTEPIYSNDAIRLLDNIGPPIEHSGMVLRFDLAEAANLININGTIDAKLHVTVETKISLEFYISRIIGAVPDYSYGTLDMPGNKIDIDGPFTSDHSTFYADVQVTNPVRYWLEHPGENNGFFIYRDNITYSEAIEIHTSDAGDFSQRPYLEIEYYGL